MLSALREDNLRVVGKRNAPRNSYSSGKFKIFLFTIALGFAFFGYMDYLAPTASTKGPASGWNIKDYAIDLMPEEFAALMSKTSMPLRKIFGLEVKTIMIDAGHGGDDPGAIGALKTKEKDITLDIANRLKRRLMNNSDLKVLMTRESDRTLSLKQRVDMTNSSRADLFISIHINSLPYKPLDIIETYYFGPTKDGDTLKLAAAENEGSSYGMSEYNDLIREFGNTLKLQESKVLARKIQKDLFLNMRTLKKDVLDFGVKRAPFVVLLGVKMPSVLVEVACLSNKEQEYKLNKAYYRENIARYLESGILKYLDLRSDS